MLPLISSLLVASTSGFWNTSPPAKEFITYTTNCMNADFKYEKDCRTNYTLVSYDNLSFRTGCGAGCHWKHQQIGEPIFFPNGWRKAWFKSKQYYFDHKSSQDVQGNPWKQRLLDLDIPEDEISDGISEGWVYAHCNNKKIAFGYPSDSNVFDAFDKNGKLIKGSVNRSTGTYYQRLCTPSK